MNFTRTGSLRSLGLCAVILLGGLSSSGLADMAVPAGELETFFSLTPDTLSDLGNGPAVNGSGIWTALLVNAGDELSFRYNFLTNEAADAGNTINDFAFFTVGDTVTPFADVLGLPLMASSAPGFASETGYQTYTFNFATSGSVLLGFGLVNVTDATFNSALLIDGLMLRSSMTTNGGFETGDFTGFATIGDSRVVGAFGASPPEGQFQAVLTTTAVPEPGSLAMLGLGVVTVLSRLRAKTRNQE